MPPPDEPWPRRKTTPCGEVAVTLVRGEERCKVERDSETQDVALAFGELRASPTRLQRLANKAVNNLGLSLVDVAVEPREAGQVAIVLPEAWAYLFLAHLEAMAKQIQENLRRAMYKAKLKDGRMQEQLEAARREWETREVKIQEQYRELIAEGLSDREAIRKIKEKSYGEYTATEIARIVTAADPRKKRARQKRDKQILALEAQGLKIRKIAEQVGVSVVTVKDVLKRKRRQQDAKADRR